MSSGSESDEDYVPKEPEQVSEEESVDEETDEQSQDEKQQRSKKRKSVQKRGKRKKVSNDETEVKEIKEPMGIVELARDPEEEKKREEDLWAKFLEGTDTKPKSTSPNTCAQPPKCSLDCNKALFGNSAKKDVGNEKERERRIFEFAGETIVVENNVIKEKLKASEASSTVSKSIPSQSRATGGLSNILGQLNKKNKLSTLEKSKLDWDTYKKVEDIDDEIQSHNKGKQGYLERQDFLARADVRQYEIERDLRMGRRNKQ
ncbi:unnamed protein product, partial [Iphiclides podalirius]